MRTSHSRAIVLLTLVASLYASACVGRAQTTPPATNPSNAASGMRITGRVVDEAGKPLAGILVEGRDRTPGERKSAQTDAAGRFEFDVRAIFLKAASPDGKEQGFQFVRPMSATGPIDVTLVMRPARQLSITAKDFGGAAVAGAWVGAQSSFLILDQAMTDVSGQATLHLPKDVPLECVFCLKDDVGLDYVSFWRQGAPKTDPYRLDFNYAGPINFTLNGTATVKVKVVDDAGHPVEGVAVNPWILSKPKKGNNANLPLDPHFQLMTDAQGVAEFHCIPADNEQQINFLTRLAGYSAPQRCLWDPKSGSAEIQTTLLAMVPVQGNVADSDGKPVANAVVQVSGAGYELDRFRNQVTTDSSGNFQIAVDPDQFYLFAARKDHDASPGQTRLVHRKDGKIEPVQLTLAPAVRVHGRITAGADNAPIAGGNSRSSVLLSLRDDGYYKLPVQDLVPGAMGRISIQPAVDQYAMANKSGEYECYLGPGKYVLFWEGDAGRATHQAFEIKAQKDVEINLHSQQAGPVVLKLTGRVVRKDKPDVGVAEVKLQGIDAGPFSGWAPPKGFSDAGGNFTLVRLSKNDVYIDAVAHDGMRGIVLVKSTQEQIVIPVGPTAIARAKIMDAQGKPIANLDVSYYLPVSSGDGTTADAFGGSAKTDADGVLVIENLVPGFEFELSTEIKSSTGGRNFRIIAKVKAEGPGVVQLQDITLKAPLK